MIPLAALRRVAGPGVALALAALGALAPAGPALPLAVVALAVWIAAEDLATFTIPDLALLALAGLGLAVRLDAGLAWGMTPADLAIGSAVDVLLAGGPFLALREGYYRLRGHDGLGFGDVKLAAAAGLLVGAPAFWMAVVVASLTGLLVFAVRAALGRRDEPRLAFGAVLAPAVAAVALAQVAGLIAGPAGG